jgi:hypothetical protein
VRCIGCGAEVWRFIVILSPAYFNNESWNLAIFHFNSRICESDQAWLLFA